MITAVLISKDDKYPQGVLDSLDFDEVLVETKCPSVARRYELALKARNDLIYVQDDDCLVDTKALIRAYNGQITNFMTPGHYASYEGSGITLIGWGALFPKKMINFDKYLDVYGVNPLFLSQADRVFTYLNQPHNSLITNVNHLPSATDGSRMSTQSDHWENLMKIRVQLETLQNN
jgi:hypothetical protein